MNRETMTRERLDHLLKIEKIMESEACLSCGGAHSGDDGGLSVYEVSEIVRKGRYDRAVICAEFSLERGDAAEEVADNAVRALAKMEIEYKNGNISEVEYARCVEAADEVINTVGPGFRELMKEYLK